jgi:hypothetical protein
LSLKVLTSPRHFSAGCSDAVGALGAVGVVAARSGLKDPSKEQIATVAAQVERTLM